MIKRYIITEVAFRPHQEVDDGIRIKLQENGEYAITRGPKFLNKVGAGYSWEGGLVKLPTYKTVEECQAVLDEIYA